MSIEIEEEPVSWFTIACLFTAVAVAFTYRFFGPDSGQPTQRKETAEKTPESTENKPAPTPVVEEVPVATAVVESSPVVEDIKDSSDSSDFENISQSEIPTSEKACLDDVQIEERESRDSSPVEEISPPESETLEETEEDIVKTMDLKEAMTASPKEVEKQPISVVDEALDEFLTEKNEIVPEPVKESCQAPVNNEPEELVEIVEEPVIPIDINTQPELKPEVESLGPVELPVVEEAAIPEPDIKKIEPDDDVSEPVKDESSLPKPDIDESAQNETDAVEDSIIENTDSLGDQTLMTPVVTRKLDLRKPENEPVIEEPITPVQINIAESSQNDVEKTIEDVAAQLIEETLEKAKSTENLEDSGHAEDESNLETEIIKKNLTIEPDNIESEIKARAEQLSEIADLVASSGMGEGVSVEEQSKLYLE